MRDKNATPVLLQRLPSLDLLRGFEAAARHLSFTKAAQEMHLTQSALSRQIRELEEQLGVELFDRRHRALSLTDAGRLLLPTAVQVVTLVRSALNDIRTLTGVRTLHVATTPAFASLWLIPRLAEFTRKHETVSVRISH